MSGQRFYWRYRMYCHMHENLFDLNKEQFGWYMLFVDEALKG